MLQPGTVLIDTENTNIENIQIQMLHLVEQGYVVYTKQVLQLGAIVRCNAKGALLQSRTVLIANEKQMYKYKYNKQI